MNCCDVLLSDKVKNMGVVVDGDIIFSGHVSKIYPKCYISSRGLHEILINSPVQLKIKLCESLMLSAIFCTSLNKADLYRLHKIQNNCI